MVVLRQNTPAPTCGVTNSFIGVLVEQESGKSSSIARAASLQAARDARAPLMSADQVRACPAACNGLSRLTTVGHGGVQTVEVNPDEGIWVSQHRAHWMVELTCSGSFTAEALATADEIAVVRHEEPLVCGKVRRSLGCVIAKATDTGSLRARAKAKQVAKVECDRLVAEDESRECPEGCFEDPVTGSQKGVKLVMAREVKQARGATRMWVAYGVAWWSVEYECIPRKESPKIGKGNDIDYESSDEMAYLESRDVADKGAAFRA